MKTAPWPPDQRHGLARAVARAGGLALTLAGVALSVPPLRHLVEQSMVWHMVVQMPLLVCAGWVCAAVLTEPRRLHEALSGVSSWNQFGLTGALAAFVVLAYWMLPSSIDRALVLPQVDAFKLLSLWACGALLQRSSRRAPLLLQLFFMGSVLPMLVWAGLYFASTDLRLCNAYSLESQVNAGRSLAALGVALGAWWTLNAALKTQAAA